MTSFGGNDVQKRSTKPIAITFLYIGAHDRTRKLQLICAEAHRLSLKQQIGANFHWIANKLIPKQLEKIPNVRFSLFEPPIIYRISDGIPYLAIPSAMGDMFSQFEYDFEAKVWTQQS